MNRRKVFVAFISFLMLVAFQNCEKFSPGSVNAPPFSIQTLPLYNSHLSSLAGATASPERVRAVVNIAYANQQWSRIVGYSQGQFVKMPYDPNLMPVFDFDGDGIFDFQKIVSIPTGTACDDGLVVYSRSSVIVSGNQPTKVLFQSGGIADVCVPINGGATQRLQAVHLGAVQPGARSNEFAFVPQYISTGWLLASSGAYGFYNPNSSAYTYYTNSRAMLQPSAGGQKYQWGGQPFNGLIIRRQGQSQYLATTSGRFLIYSMSSLSPSQLLLDSPFLARPDLTGRNYGLIQHDFSGNADRAFLFSGTGAADLFNDVQKDYGHTSLNGSDVWAAIERHVSVFDLNSGVVEQRFFNSAHDNQNGSAYVNRVTYPSQALIPSVSSLGSRMVFNLFNGMTWNAQFTVPGGTATQFILPDMYVWDIVPIDDQFVDIIASPIDKNRQVLIPNYLMDNGFPGSWKNANYFPKLETRVYRWSRAAQSAAYIQTIDGGIPYMAIPMAHAPYAANGTGSAFPSLRTYDPATGQVKLVLMGAQGNLFESRYLIE